MKTNNEFLTEKRSHCCGAKVYSDVTCSRCGFACLAVPLWKFHQYDCDREAAVDEMGTFKNHYNMERYSPPLVGRDGFFVKPYRVVE